MIHIEWLEGLANLPMIEIRDPDLHLSDRRGCEFDFVNGVWYHVQDNGLVQYFAHDGTAKNNGGFGGAKFEILHNGHPTVLIGPWSSRATAVSQRTGLDIVDVRILNPNTGHGSRAAIMLDELVARWDVPFHLVREVADRWGEYGSIVPSVDTRSIMKPSGSVISRRDVQIIFESA